MIGHMEGHFHLAHREQDAKKFFYFLTEILMLLPGKISGIGYDV